MDVLYKRTLSGLDGPTSDLMDSVYSRTDPRSELRRFLADFLVYTGSGSTSAPFGQHRAHFLVDIVLVYESLAKANRLGQPLRQEWNRTNAEKLHV